jgi:hypothetical protein
MCGAFLHAIAGRAQALPSAEMKFLDAMITFYEADRDVDFVEACRGVVDQFDKEGGQ